MHALDVHTYLTGLIRRRGHDVAGLSGAGEYVFIRDEKQTVHVVCGQSVCYSVLRDERFQQPKIADAIEALASTWRSDFSHVVAAIRGNPIYMNGAAHREARARFQSHYRATRRDLLPDLTERAVQHFDRFASAGSDKRVGADLVEPYVDGAIETILNAGATSRAISRSAWSGSTSCVFDYLHDPRRLIRKEHQFRDIAARLGSSRERRANSVAGDPVLMSYVLMGRDPVVGGLCAYMHALAAMSPRERSRDVETITARELYRRTAPVNYIGRIALKAVRIGDLDVQEGDLVVLMLPWASDGGARTAKKDLAFGAGHHICAGQSLALALGEAWIKALKVKFEAIGWDEMMPSTAVPVVFREYRETQ